MKQNFKYSMPSYALTLLLGTTLVWVYLIHKKSPANPNKVLRYVFPVAETDLILSQYKIYIQRIFCTPGI